MRQYIRNCRILHKWGLCLLDQKLGWRARVLLRQLYNLGVLHPHSSRKRCIGLDRDAVLRAGLSDACLRIERMHLDLVDHGLDPGIRRY